MADITKENLRVFIDRKKVQFTNILVNIDTINNMLISLRKKATEVNGQIEEAQKLYDGDIT